MLCSNVNKQRPFISKVIDLIFVLKKKNIYQFDL